MLKKLLKARSQDFSKNAPPIQNFALLMHLYGTFFSNFSEIYKIITKTRRILLAELIKKIRQFQKSPVSSASVSRERCTPMTLEEKGFVIPN